MRFWTSILLAAAILLISTFLLGMSALGVDIFSPQNEIDSIGVNKLVYYFKPDDQDDLQRKFIISRELSSKIDGNGKRKDNIPLDTTQADGFAVEQTQTTPVSSTAYQIQPMREPNPQAQSPLIQQQTQSEQLPVQGQSSSDVQLVFNIKNDAKYTAEIRDANNNIVRTFYKDSPQNKGKGTLAWDKKDDKGNALPQGKYFFKLTTMSPGVPVLIFHHLATSGKGYDDNPYTESPQSFQSQMEYLATNNYNVVSLNDLTEFMAGNKMLPPKSVAITFDDGYESVYTYAFPILKKLNFKATAFIIGKKAEGGQVSYVPNMTFQEMQEMYRSGVFDIQSHTYNLHNAVQISPLGQFGQAITNRIYLKKLKRMETETEFIERITNDLKMAKEVIEKNVGNTVTSLSWPHGKNLEQVSEIAKNLGYKYFIDGNLGPNYIGESVTSIKRVFVKSGITDDNFAKLLLLADKSVVVEGTEVDI